MPGSDPKPPPLPTTPDRLASSGAQTRPASEPAGAAGPAPVPPPLPSARVPADGSSATPDTAPNQLVTATWDDVADEAPNVDARADDARAVDTGPTAPSTGRPSAATPPTADLFAVPDPTPFPAPNTGPTPPTDAPRLPDAATPDRFSPESSWYAVSPTTPPPPADTTPAGGRPRPAASPDWPTPGPDRLGSYAPTPPPAYQPSQGHHPPLAPEPWPGPDDAGGRRSAAITLAMMSAVLFVVAAAIGVWWSGEYDRREAEIARLTAEHARFVDSRAEADAAVQRRYAELDVPARWTAVLAANKKYAATEQAFNAAYPSSQKSIPHAAGFALVSAVRQCLGPVVEYNRVASQFSDEVRGGLPAEVDMNAAGTNCNVIGWTTAP